jgi:hypothetical protein
VAKTTKKTSKQFGKEVWKEVFANFSTELACQQTLASPNPQIDAPQRHDGLQPKPPPVWWHHCRLAVGADCLQPLQVNLELSAGMNPSLTRMPEWYGCFRLPLAATAASS